MHSQNHRSSSSRQRPAPRPRLEQSVSAGAGNGASTSGSTRNEESWVEVPSEPSSSSLSSLGDEIVTTGLRVGSSRTAQNDPIRNRRRRSAPLMRRVPHGTAYSEYFSAASQRAIGQDNGSSSDEEVRALLLQDLPRSSPSGAGSGGVVSFAPSTRVAILPPDENEDENDHAATESETESVGDFVESDDDEEDDKHTTLAAAPPVFRPQPNAFNMQPGPRSSLGQVDGAHSQHGNYFAGRRQSAPSSWRTHQNSPPSGHYRSPSFRIDNDAALRASLNTLLSCARGLGGRSRASPEEAAEPLLLRQGGTGMMDLQIVPESELMRSNAADSSASPEQMDTAPQQGGTSKHTERTVSGTGSPDRHAASKTPDRATGSSRGKQRRSPSRAHKKRHAPTHASETRLLSPTVLTWVVSAGVVVLVSVVGFGAGYVIGREVGRQETLAAASAGVNASDAVACGAEVGTGGLRRLRWGTAVNAVVS